MAEATPPPEDAAAAAAEPAPPKKRAIKSLIKAAAIIAVIVALEMVAASMLLPTAQQTRALGQEIASARADEQLASGDDEAAREALEEMREVSLGAFHILRYDPDSETSLNIDFELYAAVIAKEESEFSQLYAVNQRRIDEQITITMRGVEVGDLTDPGLGLIKRRILEKTNRALGKPLLREAIFSKFTFYER